MKSVANSGLTSIEVIRSEEVTAEDRSHVFNPGLWAAVLANVLWGASFLASKYTLAAWGPFTAASLRFAVATVLMLVGLKLFGRDLQIPRTRRDWLWVVAIATSGFGLLYPLQLAGLKFVSSGLSASIMLTSPLFVVVFGHLFLKDTFTQTKAIALVIGIFGGVFLLNSKGSIGGSSIVSGSLLTLGASISLALSVIATRKLAGRLDSASLTFWSMGLGFVQLSLAAFAFEENSLARIFKTSTASSWTALFFLSFICSAFCFFIWNFALAKASPREIASTMHIKTPTAVLIGAAVAGETIGHDLIVGTLIVMAGVWLSQQRWSGDRK